jgi:site-specific DNA-methyltransferase (adenine-specific)
LPRTNAAQAGDAAPDAAGPKADLALNRIIEGDFLAVAATMPAACVDVIIADPPYNASKGGAWKWDAAAGLPGFGGDWRKVDQAWDDMDLEAYLGFTFAWLQAAKRLLKPTGSMWAHGVYHNAGLINFAMQALGVEIINEVIWYKRNSFPNLSGRRLTASHETILWAHVGKARKYQFNYAVSKAVDCPEDPLKQAGRQMRTVWDIPNNKDRDELRFGRHPTQKPLRLARRMLQLTTSPGQTLLAPFAGSGTECLAAAREGLNYIGVEIDPAYVKLARERLAGGGAA